MRHCTAASTHSPVPIRKRARSGASATSPAHDCPSISTRRASFVKPCCASQKDHSWYGLALPGNAAVQPRITTSTLSRPWDAALRNAISRSIWFRGAASMARAAYGATESRIPSRTNARSAPWSAVASPGSSDRMRR